MPKNPNRTGPKSAIRTRLSAAQREDFLEELRNTTELDGDKVKALVKDKFGFDVGRTAATNFLRSDFVPYIETLRMRNLERLIVNDAIKEGAGLVTDAEIAGLELASRVSLAVRTGAFGPAEINTPEGLKRLDVMSKVAKRLAAIDVQARTTDARLKESRARLKGFEAKAAELEAKQDAARKALDDMRTEATGDDAATTLAVIDAVDSVLGLKR